MTPSYQKVWANFIEQIEKGQSPRDLRDLVASLVGWLRLNRSALGASFDVYGLGRYLDLDPGAYPVDLSELSADEELQSLRRVPPSTADNLAMRIRDILEGAFVWKSRSLCPGCEGDQMLVYRVVGTDDRLVYECASCGQAQDESGKTLAPGGPGVEPVPTNVLKRKGLLLRSVR